MTLNIEFQLSGLILLIIILGLFSKRKSVDMETICDYKYLLVAVLVSVSFDIFSIFSLNYLANKWVLVNEFICKAYLISIVVVMCFVMEYIGSGLTCHIKSRRIIGRLTKIVTIIYACLILILDIKFVVNDLKTYTYGFSVMLTYFVAFFVIMMCILVFTISWKYMVVKKRRTILFLLISLMTASVIQFFINELLLVSFALSLAMFYAYMSMESPDLFFDSVTGCFNEKAFSILDEDIRNGSKLNIIYIEIDGMEFIHDTFGMEEVNKILITIAEYLKSLQNIKVFRVEDESFVVSVVGNKETLNSTLRMIKERFQDKFIVGNVETIISAKYVILQSSKNLGDISTRMELINKFLNDKSNADFEGSIIIDENYINSLSEVKRIERAIVNAMDEGRLMVYYQPIYSNKKGIYTSAEALMRIKDENGEFISPEVFVPIAEKNGLILQMGMNLFEQVCTFVEKNDLQNTNLEYIEVNLSVIQCMQHDLAEKLIEVMNRHNVKPSFINFEITETAASNSQGTLLQNMRQLINVQSSFSLDDYGSGYSNINYVLDLPIVLLKYDKNMVWSYFCSEKGRVVMEYTVNMTKELELKSLAEGVETKEQFEKIKQLGIEYTQGFYFSKPIPENEFLELVK